MRFLYIAKAFSIFGLLASLAALSAAQEAPPGGIQEVWTKVTDTSASVVHYSTTLSGTIAPNTTAYHNFPEHYKVWETLNQDTSKTAPWTTPFATLLDWTTPSNPVAATSDSNGLIVWTANWEDCLDSGTPAVQKWKYNPSGIYQERKQGYKIVQ